MQSVLGAAAAATAAASGVAFLHGYARFVCCAWRLDDILFVQLPMPLLSHWALKVSPCLAVLHLERASVVPVQLEVQKQHAPAAAAAHAGSVREWVYLFVWCLSVQCF
jgi:hypothetical protein